MTTSLAGPADLLGPQAPGPVESSRAQRVGVLMMLGSSASNQGGAALGALAFPVLTPVGVVAVRQLVAALVLVPAVRPRVRGLGRDVWWPVVGLAVVFGVMNLGLYAAAQRIGLGAAVTLEFLGPLTVAVASSRRAFHLVGAALAGVGVVVLADPGPTSDVLGIGAGLLAGTGWGCYILLNRTVGRRLPGLQGTALATLVTSAAWVPVAAVWFTLRPPTLTALALAVACGLLASVVPYATDLLVLRRVPANVFGTLSSVNPVWAALAGWLVLHQTLAPHEWTGIALVVLANVVVTSTFSVSRTTSDT